jgi:hypothetical protein
MIVPVIPVCGATCADPCISGPPVTCVRCPSPPGHLKYSYTITLSNFHLPPPYYDPSLCGPGMYPGPYYWEGSWTLTNGGIFDPCRWRTYVLNRYSIDLAYSGSSWIISLYAYSLCLGGSSQYVGLLKTGAFDPCHPEGLYTWASCSASTPDCPRNGDCCMDGPKNGEAVIS